MKQYTINGKVMTDSEITENIYTLLGDVVNDVEVIKQEHDVLMTMFTSKVNLYMICYHMWVEAIKARYGNNNQMLAVQASNNVLQILNSNWASDYDVEMQYNAFLTDIRMAKH